MLIQNEFEPIIQNRVTSYIFRCFSSIMYPHSSCIYVSEIHSLQNLDPDLIDVAKKELESLWYRLFFLRLIAQIFAQLYLNCIVSSSVEQTG